MRTLCLLLLGLFMSGVCPYQHHAQAATLEFDPAEPTINNQYQISGNWSGLKRGQGILTLKITNAEEQPVIGATVVIPYDMVTMSMHPPENAVQEKGDGIYEKKIFLGMRGPWKFNINIDANSVVDSLNKIQEIK